MGEGEGGVWGWGVGGWVRGPRAGRGCSGRDFHLGVLQTLARGAAVAPTLRLTHARATALTRYSARMREDIGPLIGWLAA